MTTVREFVENSYQLISAQSPTVPLHGDDLSRGIQTLNRLLKDYASNGLLITIARTVTSIILPGQQEVTVGPASFIPTPNITAGRIANINNAWLELSGVIYPLIYIGKPEFDST